ncbi:MAG TPA: fibrillarin-like rRNA/tRNA 2'-O-methyltransferase [candidate division WOR-3 bacterium]|uniref:rRNA 2'-O-methyltransferase fibrillarin n=1 Tax=candidate division WOR-3 bacterium TaxID=2052148 RepID=A0A7C5H8V2_UNCW3|nr:fibrillarin-like rRNA/tRNA 2'-O-methyltransferase [candidate division WOR-3 bacterium]
MKEYRKPEVSGFRKSNRFPKHNKFPLYFDKKGKRTDFYTLNLTPGEKFFDEQIKREKGKEYRHFDPGRSKLAAALLKNVSQIGLKEGDNVLYLGASHGYTPSFISDIVGKKGFVFAVDFAPRVVRDLVFVCEKRVNMAPIMADANHTFEIGPRIFNVDFVYQDVAQRNQAEIFLKNCKKFLKKEGFGILAVKSRSIDMAAKPKTIYDQVRKKLEQEVTIVDYRVLDPFEKDHCVFVIKKR